MASRLVKASDDRTIAVETAGDPRGRPVFLLHGTPGSRLGPAPRGQVLHRLGIHLISFDRPGYGDSDRRPGRRVVDAAADVAAVAEELGLTAFAVVGRSGGAPHALACAALLPDLVTRTAALVSIAPRNAPGLDWYAGMTESNVRAYTSADRGHQRIVATIQVRSRDIRADPSRLIAELRRELPPSDRRVVADPGLRRMLELNYSEALRYDAGGWIDDAVAFSQDWGFDPADIASPVLLWHGEDDTFSPVEHSRWLADRIPDSHMVVEPGAAHFGALRILPAVLRWAAR
ncbi:pimeloyl-ACP methyl ester carboxylesterase [Streptacidiphilus sp. MAP12-16]|uniref:alpha/beta fold hydrolase n=1 Tax=Streptacidiphilus sp. MAP12-16 TaxID=3156300 RepID=UPI003511AF74